MKKPSLFLKIIFVLFILVFTVSTQMQAQQKPNIIIIMADDLGHSDVSLNGGLTPTPNIDALITSGTRLNNFLVAPVCSPTRAGLLTGINPLKIGNAPRTEGILDTNILTFGGHFKSNGYKTGFFGKSHNGRSPHTNANNPHVNDYGFDRFVGFYGGGSDYFYKGRVGWYEDKTLVVGDNPTTTAEEPHYKYATDLITDKAIDFINQSVDVDNKPFLCYVPYSAIHTPYNITQEALDRVPASIKNQLTQPLRSLFDFNRAALDANGRQWNANKFTNDAFTASITNLTTEEIKVLYSALTINLDDNIGRIVNHINNKQLSDNTIILFLSDNGANLNGSNLPLKGGKQNLYEGGIRVPAGIKIPTSILSNALPVVNDVCAYTDVFPTLIALAQVGNIPSNIDGKSMVAKLTGTSTNSNSDYYYFSSSRDQDIVRGNRWKLVRAHNNSELYDLLNDPNETNNLIDNSTHAGVLNILNSRIAQKSLENLMANGHVPLINPTSAPLDVVVNPQNDVISFAIDATHGNTQEQIVKLFDIGGAGRSDGYLEYDIKIAINEADKDKLEYCFLSHSKSGNPYFSDSNGVDANGDLLKSKKSLEGYINNWERIHAGIGNIAPNAYRDYVLVYKFSSPANANVFLDNVSVKNFRTSEVKRLFYEDNNVNQELESPRPAGLSIVNASTTLSNTVYNLDKIFISKNPVKNNIYIKGLKTATPYEIYNLLGAKQANGIVKENKIEVQFLKSGLYFLKLEGNHILKFIKQ